MVYIKLFLLIFIYLPLYMYDSSREKGTINFLNYQQLLVILPVFYRLAKLK